MKQPVISILTASLAVGISTIGWPEKAQAVVVNVSGIDYNVTTFTGSYNDFSSRFSVTEMPWFGKATTTVDAFVSAVGAQLGFPNSLGGNLTPFYARSIGSNVQVRATDSTAVVFGTAILLTQSRVYAVATEVSASAPVPGPLPLFGAAAAFRWSRRLRSRIGMEYSHASS